MHLFGEWLKPLAIQLAAMLLDLQSGEDRACISTSTTSFARRRAAAVAPSVWRRIGKIETLHDRAGAAQLHARRSRALPHRNGDALWHRPYRADTNVR